MAPDEFSQWLDEHRALYPSLRKWLGGLSLNDRDRTIANWRAELRDIALADALRASKTLYQAETQPRSYERHAIEVARRARPYASHRARQQDAARFNGVDCYRCADCFDRGVASVYAYGSARERVVAMYGNEGLPRITFAVACDCRAGERMDHMPRLNRQRMTLVGKGDPATEPWPEEMAVASAATDF